ncbi:hypothetical protein F4Y59_03125 [Candidatus Poribacteria bacterium]|nr:hypothetical protein [Candidatus Poribacteria bacterium]MYK20131.1 hypothetical protein [Candidatus Poribacteria bacterium]
MKILIFLSILFSAIAFPALGELTDADLDKIRLIINEEIKPIKADIVSLKTDVAWMRGKLESVDKQFESVDKQFESVDKQFESVNKQFESVGKQITHVTYITYGLIALIVAAIAIPQILIAWRAEKSRSLERKVEMLTEEIETLKRQQIIHPRDA